jgi:hypothetical protein
MRDARVLLHLGDMLVGEAEAIGAERGRRGAALELGDHRLAAARIAETALTLSG